MITIHSLEVRFDVTTNDEQVFARLFEQFMRRWSALDDDRRRLNGLAARDRELGDRPGSEREWR